MSRFKGGNFLNTFEYLEPADIDETLSMLNRWKGNAKIIAGGTDLIPLMRDGVISPKYLIDINGLSELEFIKETGDEIRLGALTRLRTIETSPLIRENAPILAEAVEQVGSIQVRNVATVGGGLVNASPAADAAPPLLVYEAKVATRNVNGECMIPLSEFFVGVKKTTLGDDNLLTEIVIPKMPSHTGGAFMKIGKRNALIISIASAAASVNLNGKRSRVRIALGSVAPTPVRARKTEAFLEDHGITDKAIDEASELVASDINPITDLRASMEYRKTISKVLVRRVLRRAAEIAET